MFAHLKAATVFSKSGAGAEKIMRLRLLEYDNQYEVSIFLFFCFVTLKNIFANMSNGRRSPALQKI